MDPKVCRGTLAVADDIPPLPPRESVRYRPHVSHAYKYRRGDQVVVVSGSHKGSTGTVESLVFQRTTDYPEVYSAGYHVVLEDGQMVTVRWDQVDCPGG